MPIISAEHTFHHEGLDRTYLLSLPPGWDGHAKFPVVLSFHGANGRKETFDLNNSMGERGALRGFAVVTPQALGEPVARWNWRREPGRADDFDFVHTLLADLDRRIGLDVDRLYAAGHSNGCGMVAFLAGMRPFPMAAVAMVSASAPAVVPPGAAPAVLVVNGTADHKVPYDGGADGRSRRSDVQSWADRYGCSPPECDEPFPGVQRARYTGGQADVVHYTLVGGAHSWPGGLRAATLPENSEAGKTFPATDVILDFFEDHRRPGS